MRVRPSALTSSLTVWFPMGFRASSIAEDMLVDVVFPSLERHSSMGLPRLRENASSGVLNIVFDNLSRLRLPLGQRSVCLSLYADELQKGSHFGL